MTTTTRQLADYQQRASVAARLIDQCLTDVRELIAGIPGAGHMLAYAQPTMPTTFDEWAAFWRGRALDPDRDRIAALIRQAAGQGQAAA